VVDAQGQEIRWEHEILTRLSNQSDPDRRFKFALVKNDLLLLTGPDGTDVLYRVQKLSQGEIQLCEHRFGLTEKDMRTKWNQIQNIDRLRTRNARPVEVAPLGEIRLRERQPGISS
jgi:CRISPR-associated endonuclease Csn1